jgi:hypothetical protein
VFGHSPWSCVWSRESLWSRRSTPLAFCPEAVLDFADPVGADLLSLEFLLGSTQGGLGCLEFGFERVDGVAELADLVPGDCGLVTGFEGNLDRRRPPLPGTVMGVVVTKRNDSCTWRVMVCEGAARLTGLCGGPIAFRPRTLRRFPSCRHAESQNRLSEVSD